MKFLLDGLLMICDNRSELFDKGVNSVPCDVLISQPGHFDHELHLAKLLCLDMC